MSNIGEDKYKNFLESYKDIKQQSFIIESINKDFFLEFADCLTNKIKELEEENRIQRKQIMGAYDRGWIPKQKIQDAINENGFEVYTREYGNVEVVSIEVLEELLEDK